MLFFRPLFIMLLFFVSSASAQTELLSNRDFNAPLYATYGNHFPAINAVPSWTFNNAPNIVRVDGDPFGGPGSFGAAPECDAHGCGADGQYLDVIGSIAFYQTFIPTTQCVNFSGYFSYRDAGNGGPSFVRIREGSGINGTIVAQSTVLPNRSTATATGPDGILGTADDGTGQGQDEWAYTEGTVSLIPGNTYSFVGTMNNAANFDLASVITGGPDYGDAPNSYGTTTAQSGAMHCNLSNDLTLGATIDTTETDGQPSVNADGDGADEDGVTFRSPAGTNNSILADVVVTNATGGTVTACCWLDVPAGGSVDGVFDASDGQCQSTSLASPTLTFQWSGLPTDQTYDTYARCRITSDTMFTSEATGTKNDGEVEDYVISFDFTPTAVTIGDVGLESLSVGDYLNAAELDQLQALLASYGMDAEGMDSAALIAALTEFLDPDGDGQVALFRWDTLEERGTIGFYVERQNDGQDWTRVNNDLLPGLITAPMGAEYQLLDPGAQPGTSYQYRLIELEADGNTRSYGPYTLQMP